MSRILLNTPMTFIAVLNDKPLVTVHEALPKELLRAYNGAQRFPLEGVIGGVSNNVKFQVYTVRVTDGLLRFSDVYYRHLTNAHNETVYKMGLDDTYNRMLVAFIRGNYNKDSDTIKATCKELNIKHTYKAIDAFIKGGVTMKVSESYVAEISKFTVEYVRDTCDWKAGTESHWGIVDTLTHSTLEGLKDELNRNYNFSELYKLIIDDNDPRYEDRFDDEDIEEFVVSTIRVYKVSKTPVTF